MATNPDDIRLNKDLRRIIAELVDATGHDCEAVLRDALEDYRNREAFARQLETRIRRVEDGDALVLDGEEALKQFFDDIKSRGRARNADAA